MEIKILEPINYDKYNDWNEKNQMLHQVTNLGMQKIAESEQLPFHNEYLFLPPKDNIMYRDGSTLPFDIAKNEENIIRYQNDIINREHELIRT